MFLGLANENSTYPKHLAQIPNSIRFPENMTLFESTPHQP
jgi:hypothetical protein